MRGFLTLVTTRVGLFAPTQAITLLDGLILTKDDGSHMSAQHLERLYIFCLMWSLGSILELDDRAKMEHFLRDNFEHDLPPVDSQAHETIFEYLVADDGQWSICPIQAIHVHQTSKGLTFSNPSVLPDLLIRHMMLKTSGIYRREGSSRNRYAGDTVRGFVFTWQKAIRIHVYEYLH